LAIKINTLIERYKIDADTRKYDLDEIDAMSIYKTHSKKRRKSYYVQDNKRLEKIVIRKIIKKEMINYKKMKKYKELIK
jgi:5-formaminoimidazole-4-carboxamide-1-beta-D-ribofuranosyl 5'-monophosphate synthetase